MKLFNSSGSRRADSPKFMINTSKPGVPKLIFYDKKAEENATSIVTNKRIMNFENNKHP